MGLRLNSVFQDLRILLVPSFLVVLHLGMVRYCGCHLRLWFSVYNVLLVCFHSCVLAHLHVYVMLMKISSCKHAWFCIRLQLHDLYRAKSLLALCCNDFYLFLQSCLMLYTNSVIFFVLRDLIATLAACILREFPDNDPWVLRHALCASRHNGHTCHLPSSWLHVVQELVWTVILYFLSPIVWYCLLLPMIWSCDTWLLAFMQCICFSNDLFFPWSPLPLITQISPIHLQRLWYVGLGLLHWCA